MWGDGYGNRMDRFLGAIAYLDGKTPSLIMTRGYYTRTYLTAWDFRNGKIDKAYGHSIVMILHQTDHIADKAIII